MLVEMEPAPCLRSATVALPSLHGRRGLHLSEWQAIWRSIVDEQPPSI